MFPVPGLDPAALTPLAVIVAAVVQIVKSFLPQDENQNRNTRATSAVLGLVLLPAYALSRHGVVIDAQAVVDACLAGLALGTGVTVAAAGAIAMNQDRTVALPTQSGWIGTYGFGAATPAPVAPVPVTPTEPTPPTA